MKSLLRCMALVPLAFVTIAGCATEPELHEDFATYEVTSEPIPLAPIPGADIASWTEAVDGIGLGDWTSSGALVTDSYEPARAEQREDARVEEDRYWWAIEGTPPRKDADFVFAARAVTDTSEGVLSISCDAEYDFREDSLEDGLKTLQEVRRALLGCMAGSGNDAIAADGLSAWLDTQMDAAEAAFEIDRFAVSDMIAAGGVLVWFHSGTRHTSVSLSVDPRVEAGQS